MYVNERQHQPSFRRQNRTDRPFIRAFENAPEGLPQASVFNNLREKPRDRKTGLGGDTCPLPNCFFNQQRRIQGKF